MSDELDALEEAWRREKTPASSDAYLAALEARVAHEPTFMELRFKLGELLQERGDLDRAIPELQRGKLDARSRIPAAYQLALCYVKKKMAKLAVNELEAAIVDSELPLEAEGRAVAYLLGRIYEMAGRKEQALRCYRMITDDLGDGMNPMHARLRPDDPPRRPPDPPSSFASFT
jgi:tetratricopeptide (TPR) repeat protein